MITVKEVNKNFYKIYEANSIMKRFYHLVRISKKFFGRLREESECFYQSFAIQ